MKLFFTLLIAIFFSASAIAADNLNLSRRGIAVDGYDLVSYHQSDPKEGNKNISYDYMDATYYFSSQENMTLFQTEPEKYLPEYGGFCAYAMLEGDKVNIDPESYKVVNGKLYLFYNGLFGNTLEKWNDLTVESQETTLIDTADQHWQAVLSNSD